MRKWVVVFVVAVVLAAAAPHVLDWRSEHLIAARLAEVARPLGPLRPLSFSDYGEMSVWCGMAETADGRQVPYLARRSGGGFTVTPFPQGAPPDPPANDRDPNYWQARLTKAAFTGCRGLGLGRRPSIDGLRSLLNRPRFRAVVGPSETVLIAMAGARYAIPGAYWVEPRPPAKPPDAQPLRGVGLHAMLSGNSVYGAFDPAHRHGFEDEMLERTEFPLRDATAAQAGLRPLMFGKQEVAAQAHDADGTHIVYSNSHQVNADYRLTDVYLRDGSTDWVFCAHAPVPFPHCTMHIQDGRLLHQLTFENRWLPHRWGIADAVRGNWARWHAAAK